MDRRTAIATARTVARHAGRIGGKVALRVGHEVSERLAARREAARVFAPPASPPGRQETTPPAPSAPLSRGPSPADVARAVRRNAAGLPRTNPSVWKAPRRRPGPGAKLPARAGQGIVGV